MEFIIVDAVTGERVLIPDVVVTALSWTPGIALYVQLQFEGDRMQYFLGRDTRIGDVHRLDLCRQARLQHGQVLHVNDLRRRDEKT